MSEKGEFRYPPDKSPRVTPQRRPRRRQASEPPSPTASRAIFSLLFIAALIIGALYYLYTHRLLARAPFAVSVNGRTVTVLRLG